jgi:hypothetical protein
MQEFLCTILLPCVGLKLKCSRKFGICVRSYCTGVLCYISCAKDLFEDQSFLSTQHVDLHVICASTRASARVREHWDAVTADFKAKA